MTSELASATATGASTLFPPRFNSRLGSRCWFSGHLVQKKKERSHGCNRSDCILDASALRRRILGKAVKDCPDPPHQLFGRFFRANSDPLDVRKRAQREGMRLKGRERDDGFSESVRVVNLFAEVWSVACRDGEQSVRSLDVGPTRGCQRRDRVVARNEDLDALPGAACLELPEDGQLVVLQIVSGVDPKTQRLCPLWFPNGARFVRIEQLPAESSEVDLEHSRVTLGHLGRLSERIRGTRIYRLPGPYR